MSAGIDLAVIGGSGLYALPGFEPHETLQVTTPWGEPSGPIRVGVLHGRNVAFLARQNPLVVVPVVYTFLDDLSAWLKRRLHPTNLTEIPPKSGGSS